MIVKNSALIIHENRTLAIFNMATNEIIPRNLGEMDGRDDAIYERGKNMETSQTGIDIELNVRAMELQLQKRKEEEHQQIQQEQKILQAEASKSTLTTPQSLIMLTLKNDNDYLLERDGNGTSHKHEQPIYGNWQNMQTLKSNFLNETWPIDIEMQTHSLDTVNQLNRKINDNSVSSIISTSLHHEDDTLPYSSFNTLTTQQEQLHDQIPRPPRIIVSRKPSIISMTTSMHDRLQNKQKINNNPNSNQYPYDKSIPIEHIRKSDSGLSVNNIQDILQNIHLDESTPTRTPSIMIMPTNLYITGSMKNFKSNSFMKFLRNHRHKSDMLTNYPFILSQSYPMPFSTMNGHYAQQSIPIMNIIPPSYKYLIPTINTKQFNLFNSKSKFISPKHINKLVMQPYHQSLLYQETEQPYFGISNYKYKRQKDKRNHKKLLYNKNNINDQYLNMALRHPISIINANTDIADADTDADADANTDTNDNHYYPSIYSTPEISSINVKSKHIPFNVNFNTFPIVTTANIHKMSKTLPKKAIIKPSSSSTVSIEYPSQSSSIQNSIRKPYGAGYYPIFQPHLQAQQTKLISMFDLDRYQHKPKRFVYNSMRFPSVYRMPTNQLVKNTNTNYQSINPRLYMPKYLQQEQEKQRPQQPLLLTPYLINRSDDEIPIGLSTTECQPKINSMDCINLKPIIINSKQNPFKISPSSDIKQSTNPFYESYYHNKMINNDILSSNFDDNKDTIQNRDIIHNQNKNEQINENSSNSSSNKNIDEMLDEAKTVSFFRFPVEELIQFETHDAI